MHNTLERLLLRMTGMKDRDARRSRRRAIRDVIPLRRVHHWDDSSRLPAPWDRWTTIEAQRWDFPLFQSAKIDSLKFLLFYLTFHVSIGEVSFIYLTFYVSIGDLFNGSFLYLFVKGCSFNHLQSGQLVVLAQLNSKIGRYSKLAAM